MGQRTHVPPTSFAYDRSDLILSVNNIFLMVREALGFDEVCVRDVEYLFALKAHDKTWSRHERVSKLAIPERKFCIPKHDIDIPEGTDPQWGFPVKETIPLGSIPRGYAHYSYPFDSIDIQVHFRTTLDYYKDGNLSLSKQVPMGILISIGITGWELWTYDVDNSIKISPLDIFPLDLGREEHRMINPTNTLLLTFKRPMFIKLLTPAPLIVLYIITLSIILFKPPDLIVEISIGVLIGIWGTRQILLPSEAQSWTLVGLVDMSLLVTYFLVVSIFAVQVLWQTWLLVKGTVPSGGSRRSHSTLLRNREYHRPSQVERIMLWLLIPVLAYHLVRSRPDTSGKDNKAT
jgi:hypothetical protein